MTDILIVTVEEAKMHLHRTGSDDDAYIQSLIQVAQAHGALWQGRTYLETTLTEYWQYFPDTFYLPYPPLVATNGITSIKYVDNNGTWQTLADTAYRVDAASEPGRVTLEYGQSWPSVRPVRNCVEVIYKAGYASASAVPVEFKYACLLLVGHLYEHRESVVEADLSEMPMGWKALLWPKRVHPTCK